jgi:tryptophan synthase alpha chain
MNRIDQLFRKKASSVISVYFTAGYPRLNDTGEIIKELEEQGADMIEIGIPFSDPLADGSVIQKSSNIALQNGMNLKLLFQQLETIRYRVNIPLLFMSYLNPVLKYGFTNFCRNAAAVGIDGVILPDMPPENYAEEFKDFLDQHNLRNILLVSPNTPENRLKDILNYSEGFVYMVSTNSTTGDKKDIGKNLDYVCKIKSINGNIPVMVGFGIDSKEKFRHVCKFANGAILGSSFIRCLNGNISGSVERFMKTIKF